MTRIQELLKEHCPEGVQFKSLGQIGEFIRGQGLQKVDFVEAGEPCIHYGQIYTFYKKYVTETKSFVTPELKLRLKTAPSGSLIITTTSENIPDVARTVVWLGQGDVVFGGHSCAFTHNENPRYLAYALETSEFQARKNALVQGTKVKDISLAKLASISIPLPPRLVQDHIADILDKFYALEAELEAELVARKIQLHEYTSKMLDPEEFSEVEWLPLGDLITYEQPGAYLVSSKNYSPTFETPVLTAGKTFILGFTDELEGIYPASESEPVIIFDDFTTSMQWVDFPFKVKSSAMKMLTATKSEISLRYLWFKMKTIDYKPFEHSRQWIGTYSNFLIPLPPIEEQLQVVGVLNNLEALVGNLEYGLPAEIKARRKQYEYYRDQLLTFKEA